ncbi:MAG: type II 3-dehydroquinate dehydratase [Candidatus Aminicenantales bacterium]
MKKKLLVINGPNLNLLGERETEIYGKMTLNQIEEKLKKYAEEKAVEVEFFQSNFEGEIIEKIHKARTSFEGIIINPAALSHTSYSILDALKAAAIPCLEVHLSNIFAREDFRKNSITASACLAVISGLGWKGYLYALIHLLE